MEGGRGRKRHLQAIHAMNENASIACVSWHAWLMIVLTKLHSEKTADVWSTTNAPVAIQSTQRMAEQNTTLGRIRTRKGWGRRNSQSQESSTTTKDVKAPLRRKSMRSLGDIQLQQCPNEVYMSGSHYGEREHRQSTSGDGERGEVVIEIEVRLRQGGDVRTEGRDDDAASSSERCPQTAR